MTEYEYRVGDTDAGLAPAGIDQPRIEKAVREILLAIGEDPDRDGLVETRPGRTGSGQFAGLSQRPEDVLTTVFEANHEEMVLVKDIELYSTCEHHLSPSTGLRTWGTSPTRTAGSPDCQTGRLVDIARRPQVQERLTSQVATR